MKYFISIVLLILVIFLVFYGIPNTDKNITEAYQKLYSAKLNGSIEYLDIKYHRDSFKLNNTEEYVFSSFPTSFNHKSFASLARKGNLVVKLPNSDTLTLIKDGNIYKFLIKREL